jgi:hypothetical protein
MSKQKNWAEKKLFAVQIKIFPILFRNNNNKRKNIGDTIIQILKNIIPAQVAQQVLNTFFKFTSNIIPLMHNIVF